MKENSTLKKKKNRYQMKATLVKFNTGGTVFSTFKTTISNRSPKYLNYILDYLRNSKLNLSPRVVKRNAILSNKRPKRFYQRFVQSNMVRSNRQDINYFKTNLWI